MRLKNVLCTACAAAFAAVMFFGFNVKSFAADMYEGTLRARNLIDLEETTDAEGMPAYNPIYSDEYNINVTFTSEGLSSVHGYFEKDLIFKEYFFRIYLVYGNNEILAPGTYTATVTFPMNMIQNENSFFEQIGDASAEDRPYTISGNQLSFTFDGSNYSSFLDDEGNECYEYLIMGSFAYEETSNNSNDAYNANLESKANLINYYSGLDEGQKEPAVVELNEGTALNDGLIKAMSEAKNVVLKFTYTYEGVQYLTTVTPEAAKAAYDPEIPWYGPLFLRVHFPTVVVE